ncbi:hypothetical protein CFC21_056462 [Triticum aestivum]|uniref:RNase H type-1 domain-containing protein n=2 Tax=Triticum aestivum TaxID=4565 RepID=A0A3B6ILI5_WHEAT|nr:hypothetical protein CFC21_056462 [Triticum aestivum]
MQGMALSIQHSDLPVVVQTDSSEAMSSLTNGALVHLLFGHIVREIKDLLGNREFFPQKISRLQNRVADRLAKYSRSERATAVWLGLAPSCIKDIWPLDCNSIHLQ